MRSQILFLFVSCWVALSASASFADLPGQWTQSTYSGPTGSRNYYLYVPKNTGGVDSLPLMVMLHGCTQDAQTLAHDTGMNAVAEKYGFAVVYPEQTSQDNAIKCWNWFKPENQKRNSGELGIVVGIVGAVRQTLKIDSQHIYVAGISAGAAMATNLLACHADLFAGGGIESGLEYEAATSELEAYQVMSTGPSHDFKKTASDAEQCTGAGAKMPAVIIFHGTADTTVNPVNATRIVQQFTAINDLFDDGIANDSQTMTPIESLTAQVPNGYKYTTETYGGQGLVHVEKVMVEGMSHAWSGSPQAGQYADPKGPDASEMIWQFLSTHSVGR